MPTEETLLVVLDGTTSQNAMAQARQRRRKWRRFLNGIVLTKLDGTAKGGNCRGDSGRTGISCKICRDWGKRSTILHQKFNADDFVNALFQTEGK